MEDSINYFYIVLKYSLIRKVFITACCLFFIVLIIAIRRDISLIPQYPRDLRNRITGARLIEDGKDPYFFKWQPSDPMKYYEPKDYKGLEVSSSTSSPFFHRLISPLNHLSFLTIAQIWLGLEYLFFLLMVFIGVYFYNSYSVKSCILLLSGGFLLTDAWITHVLVGQMYIFLASATFILATVFNRSKGNTHYLWLGLLAACTILIRPPVLLIYLPLIFRIKKCYRFCLSTTIWLVAYLIVLVFNSGERSLWMSYNKSIQIHTQIHAGLIKEKVVPITDNIRFLEGYDFRKVDSLVKVSSVKSHNELGNLIYLQKMITGINIAPNAASIISIWVLVIILLLFWYFHRQPALHNIFILGYILYLTWELLSPIVRNQYYTVEFFPLVLLVVANVKRMWAIAPVLIVIGVILNITNTPLIPVRHTIGELFMLFGAFWFLFSKQKAMTNELRIKN